MMLLLAAGLGAGVAIGLLLAVAGLRDTVPDQIRWSELTARLPTRVAKLADGLARTSKLRLVAATLMGIAVWSLLGWPVVAIITAAVVLALPSLLGRVSARDRAGVEQLEGLEEWCRRLGDLLGAGQGLEQAITASLRTAPEQIRYEVGGLVTRLRAGIEIRAAIRKFADDLDDPSGDLVAAALLLAARRRGAEVGSVLDGLAASLAEEVAMRRQVEADRAKPRTTARLVMLLTIGAAAGMAVLQPTWLTPYDSLLGQTILAALAAAIAGLFGWMRALGTPAAQPRLFLSRPPSRQAAPIGSGVR